VPSGGLGPTPGLSRGLSRVLRLVLQIYVSPEKAFEVTEGSNPVPATTFVITHSPSGSIRRDGFSFSEERSIRADLVSVRNWCRCVGVGLVPGIEEALGFRTGRRGLARFGGTERTDAPTGIVNTSDANGYRGDSCLRRGRASRQRYQE
jgi:hypothetical protein